MPLRDIELWSAASMVLATHGERAPLFVAERIGALALAGDAEGIAVWQAIARRLSELGADAGPVAVTH
ncbi:hypothetical protein [Sphingomonas sp. NIBR02145]|uniref:DUF6961 family protein n=1 Tax=Sphingomonas sp. NIBR02145 TaxID=3014784 RepID=UPI0022B4E1C9|nr:hypothetical protein [Sphingomonas sp. NIBR02145]WHU02476.1 hypothetical protein O3305_20220 [Sphingomonas sp. NIBR02145]